ncbi:MAG: hypothetical protein AAF334_02695, partial [Pseudomonadota bacterium]
MAKKMLIDATHPEETRVVVVDGNKVEDFDFESINKRQLAGNIYLAKVTRVEPSLQAAFVEYGGNRHGFLAFSEVHPDYYQIPVADREALLAEEAREEDERRAREESDPDEERPQRNKRRDRKRGRRDANDDAKDQGAAIAGLEVIDVGSESETEPGPEDRSVPESGVPRGLEIAGDSQDEPEDDHADPLPVATLGGEETEKVNGTGAVDGQESSESEGLSDEASANETAAPAASDSGSEVTGSEDADAKAETAEVAEETAGSAAEAADQSVVAALETDAALNETGTEGDPEAVEEVAEEDDAAAEDSAGGSKPKSIAESSGLDDDERVSSDPIDAGRRRPDPEDATATEDGETGAGISDPVAQTDESDRNEAPLDTGKAPDVAEQEPHGTPEQSTGLVAPEPETAEVPSVTAEADEGSPGAAGETHEAVSADDQPAGDGDQSPEPVGDKDRVAEPDVSENETTIEPLGADTSTSDSA